MIELHQASISELGRLLDDGNVSSVELVELFETRIAAEDGAFRSIAFLNPDAAAIARERDRERRAGRVRGSLHGIPILIKDNIATGDSMMTTAGSLALDGTRMSTDSHVVRRLREAGAIVAGKTNLSEWANFRSTRSSSGWSSRGGQVRNAYAIDRSPGGSSSGSGVAVARAFAPAAIGTETDGSIVNPSAMNGIVGIKPTLGLVSRTGIIPIAHSQDTAGPMARSVADAALVLGAIAGPDPNDPATASASAGGLDARPGPEALRGCRIGVVRNYCGFNDGVDGVVAEAVAALAGAGAIIVDGLTLPSRADLRVAEIVVMLTEFRAGLNAWLAALGPECPVHSLSELIAFNDDHADRTMPYFGQELLLAAERANGLDDPEYRQALDTCHRLARIEGIDRVLDGDALDALVAPTAPVPWAIDPISGDHRLGGSSGPAAIAGYPSVTVPAGQVSGLPVGLSFIGRAWQDGSLIGLAHAFEQVTQARVAPGPPRRWLDSVA